MRKLLLVAGAMFTLVAGAAQAGSVIDPTNDFLLSYVGNHDADLDVTNFSVLFNSATNIFTLNATVAGPINQSIEGFYVFGVNTGTGVLHPFADTGNPNVLFNQAFAVRKSNGTATLAGTPLAVSISGANLSVIVPNSLLISTGFGPGQYGWNLWPRNGLGNNNQISDFAPNDATLQAIPEPASWALMITGFGLMGGVLRRRRTATSGAPA